MLKIILIISFLLPFQIALNPTAGIDLASIRIFILFIFLVWLALGLKRKNIMLPNELQGGLILSFLFLNIFSLFFAGNIEWGLRKLLFLFSIAPVYFVFADIVSNNEKIIKIAKSLIWSGFFVSLIGITQFLLQFILGVEKVYKFWADYVIAPFLGESFSETVLQNPSWLVNISGETYFRATAIFPDPHMLAFFLNIIIFLSLGLIFHLKNKRLVYIIILFFLFSTSLLTFSRGGYLGLSAGLVFLAFYYIPKLSKKYKMAIVAVVFLLGMLLFIPSPISQRFFSSFNLKEGSNKGRIETWGKAVEIIASHPIFGVGIGNYPLEIKAVAGYREPIYSHNAYLDIAAETGILNALIWISIIFLSLKAYFAKLKKDIFFLGTAAALLSFAAHSLVETPIYSPVVLTLFLILISFASIKKEEGVIPSEAKRS